MHTCGLHHSNRLAAFFAALTGVLYGCTITLAAASYGHGATTMAVLVVRCGFAGGFLSVIYGIMCIRAACGSSRICRTMSTSATRLTARRAALSAQAPIATGRGWQLQRAPA